MNWRTSGDTTLAAFTAALPASSRLKQRDEVAACYAAASPYSRLCLGMLKAESSYATDFDAVPASMNNPLNLRVRGQEPFQQFASIADCIREWKDRITSPTYAYKNTQTVRDLVSIYAPGFDNNDVDAYVRTVETVIAALPLLSIPTPPKETPPVSTPTGWKLYNVAGLSKPIALPVPLIIDLLPFSETQRPGIRRIEPGYWVQHETGNPAPGADAAMHNRWLHGGVPWVSFHFVVDDGVIYQMVPVNEITYQSADGAGPGNMSGVSCELCINRGIDKAKARHNAEALAGGVMGALSLGADRTKRHWDFNYVNRPEDRHHCPDEMMNEGYWPTFVTNVGRLIEGQVGPAYAKPIVYDWLEAAEAGKGLDRVIGRTKVYYLPQVYTAIRETPRKQATGKNDKIIGPPIEEGERFKADYVYRSAGVSYVLTPYGTRVRAADLLPKVQISTKGTISVRRTADQVKGEVVRKATAPKEAA